MASQLKFVKRIGMAVVDKNIHETKELSRFHLEDSTKPPIKGVSSSKHVDFAEPSRRESHPSSNDKPSGFPLYKFLYSRGICNAYRLYMLACSRLSNTT